MRILHACSLSVIPYRVFVDITNNCDYIPQKNDLCTRPKIGLDTKVIHCGNVLLRHRKYVHVHVHVVSSVINVKYTNI